MSFIVVYPSQLELLNDPAGNDYLLGYSPTVGKMVRISVNALLSGKIVPLWDPETDWLTGEKVEWNLKFWKSLDDRSDSKTIQMVKRTFACLIPESLQSLTVFFTSLMVTHCICLIKNPDFY